MFSKRKSAVLTVNKLLLYINKRPRFHLCILQPEMSLLSKRICQHVKHFTYPLQCTHPMYGLMMSGSISQTGGMIGCVASLEVNAEARRAQLAFSIGARFVR